jgi:hypothetical protein
MRVALLLDDPCAKVDASVQQAGSPVPSRPAGAPSGADGTISAS